jgi:hypothetical protein
MTKADFYSGLGSKRDWIGSLIRDGSVWNIPAEILLQVNKTMFEEMVMDFIRSKDGVVADDGDGWPWMWADSRMTDYSYIFLPDFEKVYMTQCPSLILVDPIKILQGESLMEANTYLEEPAFPIMDKDSYLKTEEIMLIYGYSPSQIV